MIDFILDQSISHTYNFKHDATLPVNDATLPVNKDIPIEQMMM
jgi:hypothetical protein